MLPDILGDKAPTHHQSWSSGHPHQRPSRSHLGPAGASQGLFSSRNCQFDSAMAPDSSSAPGAPSSAPQSPVEKPSAPPVNILPSPASRIYSFAHPALLLALGATRFEALVADPTKELLATLPWLTLLQVFYVILCLPPAGSTPTETGASPADSKTSPRTSGPGGATRHGKHGKRKQHANSWACIWSRSLVRDTCPIEC
jgi:hypothetical protein